MGQCMSAFSKLLHPTRKEREEIEKWAVQLLYNLCLFCIISITQKDDNLFEAFSCVKSLP